MSVEELEMLLDACKNGNRLSQKRIYRQFYNLGMSVSIRYAQNREEAEEICHDGFLKAFTKIGDCAGVGSFIPWLKKIFIHAAIDYFRKYRQTQPQLDELELAIHLSSESVAVDKISFDEKLGLIQALPPAYRLAFNLYAIEGFSTTEIAESLQISEGTVRANVAKARVRLQTMIQASNKIDTTV